MIAGVIGDPVAHSLSPVMQNAAFRHLGIDVGYELWPTPLTELPARIAAIRKGAVLGANVTVPHKQAVMPLVDQLSDTAQLVGAVNTIIVADGGLLGDNTDVAGFARSVDELRPGWKPARAVVLGAGGASRAVLVALRELGAATILLANRTDERAHRLVAALSVVHAQVTPWRELPDALAGADLLVNATSLGWHPGEIPIEARLLDRLAPDALVADLTYRDTDLLRAAAATGRATLDGLPMLVYQGAASFERWTGRPAPVDVMRAAVAAEQARRRAADAAPRMDSRKTAPPRDSGPPRPPRTA